MPDYVRVRLANGAHHTTSRADALNRGLQIIDRPATDRYGFPLPTKYHAEIHRTSASESSAEQKDTDTDLEVSVDQPDEEGDE